MKIQKRKTLAILAIIVLLFGIMPMNISNAAGAKFTVDKVSTNVGETVTVNVKLDGSVKANAVVPKLTFDKSKLEVISVTGGDVYTNANTPLNMISDENDANNNGFISATMGNITDFTLNSGVVFKVEFKVKDGASGEQALTLDLESLSNAAGEDLSSSAIIESGNINVVIPITGVTLNKTATTLNVDEEETLTATVAPEDATENKTVTWTSSDNSIVTVSNGKIKAVAPGKATITAKAGSKSATCTVDVKAPLTGISLNKTTASLLKGQSTDLSVTYVPSNTTDNKAVTWTTSNSDVATVSNGKVTGLKEGEATITAKVGDFEATCNITVTEKKLSFIKLNEDFELFLGDSTDLTVEYNPEDTTDDKTVTWSSSDNTVVKVDATGKVTALKIGEATITATVGTKTASVKIIVPEVLIESIDAKLDTDKVEVDGTANIVITTNPEKVTEEVVATYTSSDETIAKVDENGKVLGLKPGKATITVKVNEDFEKTVEVEVVEKTVEKTTEAESTTEAKSELPKTGDIAIGAFVVLMVMSVAGIVLVYRKKLAK